MPIDPLMLSSSLDHHWAAVRRLLLVRLDNIGDVVLLSAALRTIRENLPEVEMTLMCSPAGSQAVPLLPWVDETLVWRAIWQDVGGRMPLDPAREMDLVERLRERGYDAAVVFTSFSQSPHAAAYTCYLAGIPLRLGESKEFGGGVLTTEVRSLPDDLYQGERSLRLLEAVGFQVRDRRPEARISEGARKSAESILRGRGVDPGEAYLLVHPGASCQARRYPLDRFAGVVHLLRRRLGLRVLLTGSEKESPALWEVAAGCPGGVVSVAGETAVEELASLVAGAKLVVCNDSLPMHLCSALGVPSLVLFSGTDLESQWRSPHTPTRLLRRETSCSPCYRFECPYRMECLEFAPSEVVEAAGEMLREGGEGPSPLPALEGAGGAPGRSGGQGSEGEELRR